MCVTVSSRIRSTSSTRHTPGGGATSRSSWLTAWTTGAAMWMSTKSGTAGGCSSAVASQPIAMRKEDGEVDNSLSLTPEELLTTTRVVRKRLDLRRPVEREVLEECLAVAVQAPTASNRQEWH